MHAPDQQSRIPEPELRPERGWYYGWVMMPVAAIMMIATLPGQTVIVSQFNTAIRESLAIDKTELSGAYFVGTLLAAVPLTLVGRLADRIGPRRTAALVAGAFAVGLLTVANARSVAALTLGFFLIRFLGQGALGMLSGHVLALWFERRLATIESIKHSAMGLAGAIAPAAVVWLIARVGWREAYAWLAVAVVLAVLPLIATVFRDRPSEVGQHLDNERPGDHARWRRAHKTNQPIEPERVFTLRQTLGTRVFWLLLLPGFLSGSVGTAMLFHIQPIVEPVAGTATVRTGTAAVSAWAIAMPIGLLIGGVLADRFPPRFLAPIGAAGVGVASAVLALMTQPWHAAAGMAAFGFGQGVGMSAINPAFARFFGRPHHGAIRGVVTTTMVAGTATGPLALSLSHDLSDDRFAPGLLACAAISVPVALGAALIRKPGIPAGHQSESS